mmetsp:Transcript_14544/g.33939  ORF Transcript_14544/g.33939 Transcript_14544/m.33939 type:complete len:206 (+) Transcript_14544:15809-16426(+)
MLARRTEYTPTTAPSSPLSSNTGRAKRILRAPRREANESISPCRSMFWTNTRSSGWAERRSSKTCSASSEPVRAAMESVRDTTSSLWRTKTTCEFQGSPANAARSMLSTVSTTSSMAPPDTPTATASTSITSTSMSGTRSPANSAAVVTILCLMRPFSSPPRSTKLRGAVTHTVRGTNQSKGRNETEAGCMASRPRPAEVSMVTS